MSPKQIADIWGDATGATGTERIVISIVLVFEQPFILVTTTLYVPVEDTTIVWLVEVVDHK